MRAARALLCAVALAVVGAPALPAHAAGSTFADREAARGLSGKGYELYEAGDFQRAVELFRQAEARFHAPPHLLYVARAQVKLGSMVEAMGTYRLITDEKLGPDAPGPFKEAQASARLELVQLEALAPTLVVVVEGEPPPGTRVLLDGVPLDPAQLGVATRQNPGAHTVRAEPPGQLPLERAVVLKAGGPEARVSLPFPRAAGSVVPAVIAFSAGAAGLGVGIAAAILATHAAAGSVTSLHAAEIAGFATGGAGIVTGVVLIAVRTRGAAGPVAHAPVPPVRAWASIGPGALSVAGEF